MGLEYSKEDDSEVFNMLNTVQHLLLPFATAEWPALVPDLCLGLEDVLLALPPGVHFQELLDKPLPLLPA